MELQRVVLQSYSCVGGKVMLGAAGVWRVVWEREVTNKRLQKEEHTG